MPVIHATSCEINEGFFSRFSGCKGKPVGLCIYCGRAFCEAHGEVRDAGEEICSRKNCVAKRDDLVVHLQYVESAVRENELILCGHPTCEDRPYGQCGRCRAYYCARHLETREEQVIQGSRRSAQMLTLCPHCWARRPIWTRT